MTKKRKVPSELQSDIENAIMEQMKKHNPSVREGLEDLTSAYVTIISICGVVAGHPSPKEFVVNVLRETIDAVEASGNSNYN